MVLGISLFRDEPIADVVRRLNICSQGLVNEYLLAKSGISTARQCLGPQPLEWLFRKTGSHWGRERYPNDDWNGLQALAVDGALFRTPDTPEFREHFGSSNTSSNRQTPYPVMRLVGLMARKQNGPIRKLGAFYSPTMWYAERLGKRQLHIRGILGK